MAVAQVVGIASLDVGTPPPIGVEPQGGFTEDRKAAALYGVTSLTYEFLDGANVAVSGTDLKFVGQKFGAELGLGGTLDWADGAHTLHDELLTSTSFQGSYAIKGTLGFNSPF
ncbi:MAG TPA: hypothetical protein VL147_14380 [Devosia sp.]|nr:hypothetical protein [Devosia sp.]